MKFPAAHSIGEISKDQVLTRKCYQATLASGENYTWMIDEPEPVPKLSEVPQEVEVTPGDPSKVLKIGSTLGIDRGVIQHRLNKACPKDSFPLLRIDQLVDSTVGHKLLSFMDAFSSYN